MITRALRWSARYGKAWLVAGLLAGLLLPDLSAIVRPWLREIVAFLLFLTALRIGPRAAFGAVAEARLAFVFALVFQLVMPLAAIGAFSAFGRLDTPLALVLILMMAAPSITGGPNFAILLGQDPTPALRLLIVGTALFPLTVLPVLWFNPGLGDRAEVLGAALRLIAIIAGAVAAAFALRWAAARDLPDERREALDGLSVIMLAVIVIGLMSALGPALRTAPEDVLFWLALAFGANFGLQAATYVVLRALGDDRRAASVGIAAGNRNIALFLVALPPEVMDPLLIFIGCYQLPMYLTPIVLKPLYRTLPKRT